ncbi:MAG TPA: BTAD domain-containing putative transcriptional regulator, partial [Actinomycetota bacterium]
CRAALEVWRGPALGGVGGRSIEAAAARLEEERLALLVHRVEADLQLGRHAELVAELGALVATHPLQEGLRGALMLALFRAGRQAEALEVFRDARRTLVDELGVEPGPELRRLHERMLRADPALELEPAPGPGTGGRPSAIPSQLPADIADFTGRNKQVAQIHDLLALDPEGGDLPAAVVVAAVAGKPGVGKTSLAVHVAHQLRACFPDGHLYVNLRGAERQPADPGDVLAGFLRALGVEAGAIPADAGERSNLYRSRLAGRRILVLLDNAARERQVRPLLPGSPGCAVLVTSRARLAGLEGAHLIDLDVLEPDQAVELLAQVAGPDRVGAEPETAGELALRCGYLPLAVRILGAKLRARPHRRLAWLCRRLGDERRRLDELALGDLEVRASLALSYEELGPTERRAFRRLGLLEAHDFAAWAVSALLDARVGEGEDLVDALVDAQLLEVAGRDATGRLRYRFHDLIRLFARERAEAEESAAGRSRALERAFGAWLAVAEEAHARLARGFFDAPHGTALRWPLDGETGEELLADPLGWFESERMALVAAVEQSRDWGLPQTAWDIAVSLGAFFKLRGYFDDWQHTFDVALAATRATGDRRGEAAVLWGLGELHTFQDRYDTALGYLEGARAVFGELGDRYGEAGTAAGCGLVCRVRGNHGAALEWFGRALAISQQSGLPRSEAYALIGMGAVFAERGAHGDAQDCFEGALAICREAGYRDGEAQALWRLGRLEHQEGHLKAAGAYLRAALDLWAELGYTLGSAHAGQSLGELALTEGRTEDAERLLARALEVYRDLGDRYGEALTLRCCGEAQLARGRFAEAAGCLQEALCTWRELRVPLGEARTLVVLGDVHAATGDGEAARAAWAEALRRFRQLDTPEGPEQAEVARRLEAAG